MAMWTLPSEIALFDPRLLSALTIPFLFSLARRFMRLAQLPDELETLLQHHKLSVRANSHRVQNMC